MKFVIYLCTGFRIQEVKSDSFIIEIAENTRVRIAKDSVYPSAAEAKDSGADQAK